MNDLYVENELDKLKCLSAGVLKLIAAFTMLIDHVGAVIVAGYFSYVEDVTNLSRIYDTFRIVGRIAFPLFCFFVAEGFLHTKDRLKYIIRVLIFAFISEPAFDLAFSGKVFDVSHQNVMLTIALALIGLYFYDIIEKKLQGSIYKLVSVVPIIASAFLAHILRTDYSHAGVVAIAVMYLFINNKILGFFAGTAILAFAFGGIEVFSVFALIPVLFYNGKRGLNIKYFFYLFYPLHLIAIRIIFYFIEKNLSLAG